MKKLGIVVISLGVIFLLGWAGATYVFASKTESVVDQLLAEANETMSAQWDFLSIEKSSFEKGFVSSTATTSIYPAGKEVPDDKKLHLKHTIYHGPIAMTPDGPKVCGSHTVSVFDWSQLDEDDRQEMKEMFGEEEPVTMRTTQQVDGAWEFEMEVAAASFSKDGTEGKFGGFVGTVAMNSERSEFSGKFDAAESEMKFPDKEGSLKIHPSTADFFYTKSKALKGNLKLGAVDGVIDRGTMNITETTGVIDIKNDSHFKMDVKLGDLEMIAPPEQDFTMSASGLVFTADFSRIDETSLITVGKGELRAPKLDIQADGSSILLSDFRIGVETGLEVDKLFGQLEYGFGGIKMSGAEFQGAEELNGVLEKGASLAFGVRGIDRPAIENFYGFIEVATEKSEGNSPDLQSLAPELADMFSDDLFNLFQPGLEIFYELVVGERGNGMEANLSLKMGGEKRLDELKSGREIVNAIKGTLRAEVANSFLDDEKMQMMMAEYVQQGLIQAKEDQSGYEFKGDLTNGVLHLAGEATPMLDSFGPLLDEPIPWDEFKAGMKAGIMESAESAEGAAKAAMRELESKSESDDKDLKESE
jgi:hypothetical protein